jgi:3'(2'), 5'-bisphosphate nucleotidase
MELDRELAAALDAAARAARVILDHYRERTAIADAPASISTATDRASQEIILEALAEQFPNDAFRAEEATTTLKRLPTTGRRMWIIDPIDGTRGFAKKNDEFSVMIALVEEGAVLVGAVLEPAKERMTYAARHFGCWRRDGGANAEQVRVSTNADPERLTLTQSHTKPGRAPTAAVRMLQPQTVLETYSAGIKLAQVARGEADVYSCEYEAMNDWDIAAGEILVAEAGGRVTTNQGRALHFGRSDPLQTGRLLATNGAVHEAVMARLATAS